MKVVRDLGQLHKTGEAGGGSVVAGLSQAGAGEIGLASVSFNSGFSWGDLRVNLHLTGLVSFGF